MARQIKSETSDDGEVKLIDVILSIQDWIRYFFKFWWLFLFAGTAGVTAGYFYAKMQKPVYESKLTFALDDNSGGSLSGALGIASQFGIDLEGNSKSIFTGDNIIEILKSRRIVERVLLSVDSQRQTPKTIADEFIEISGLKKAYAKNIALKNISFPANTLDQKYSYLQDSVLYVIYNGIVTNNLSAQKPDKKLNIYEIKFKSPDERFAKIFVDRLIIEATAFYTELRLKRSRETLEILEQRVNALKGNLTSAVSSKAVLKDANLNPAFSAAQALTQKKDIDISVYGGAYGELFKNLELARYQYLKDIPLLQVIDSPKLPMKKIKSGKLITGILFGAIVTFILLLILSFRKYYQENIHTRIIAAANT